jgi:hypothetical protein
MPVEHSAPGPGRDVRPLFDCRHCIIDEAIKRSMFTAQIGHCGIRLGTLEGRGQVDAGRLVRRLG